MFPFQQSLVFLCASKLKHLQLHWFTAKIRGKFSFSCNYKYAIYKVSLALENKFLWLVFFCVSAHLWRVQPVLWYPHQALLDKVDRQPWEIEIISSLNVYHLLVNLWFSSSLLWSGPFWCRQRCKLQRTYRGYRGPLWYCSCVDKDDGGNEYNDKDDDDGVDMNTNTTNTNIQL